MHMAQIEFKEAKFILKNTKNVHFITSHSDPYRAKNEKRKRLGKAQTGWITLFNKKDNLKKKWITLMNENYIHPKLPANVEKGIIKGMYKLDREGNSETDVVLFGCGTILREVEQAAKILHKDYNISSDVWSITSFTELKRDAENVEHQNIHDISSSPRQSFLASELAYFDGPVVAATDYVRTFPEQIRPHLDNPYYTLGTDGFGKSDTRANLREYFGVNAKKIAYMAMFALYQENIITIEKLKDAYDRYEISTERAYTLYT